jgi:predicted nucleic acid-binding protein
MVLEAAINGQADVLVTYNLADFAGIAERFRIEVMHPADLLKRMKIR